METLFSSKNTEILYIGDTNIIVIKFIGDMTDQAYFEIWEKGLILMTSKNSKRLIIDQTEGGHVSYQARNKVVNVYMEHYKRITGGEIKVGVLVSENDLNSAGAKYLVEVFRKGTSFNIEFFKNRIEATKWLGAIG